MSASANIARHLPLMAARQPDFPAIKIPRGRRGDRIDYLALSFRELDAEVDAWVAHLQRRGVRRDDRVLVMVRQGLPLIAAAFALFKLGAVPVIIDPGMGKESFLACVARSRPRVLLGIPLAQLFSYLHRAAFASVAVRVWVSGSATARRSAAKSRLAPTTLVDSAATDLAAVLFTSGSTGAPKGVCYEHGMFDAQVRLVRDTYGIQPGEVDLPLLPIFALFNPALGMTTIVPEIDPSKPATVDPAKVVQAIRQECVTNSFGSPTLWRKIAAHCAETQTPLPTLRRVLMAGAPVPPALFAAVQELLPEGAAHSPYGATEALPLCSITAAEVSAETAAATARGAGTCVGRPVLGIELRIIALTDGPIATLADTRELPVGEIGEIIVRGPVVTKGYDALPEATAAAKIAGPDGTVWHRMGDAGYLDAQGRLWFCGRKAERVETRQGTLYPDQVEAIFNAHPEVRRTALVGIGPRPHQRPAIVAEPLSREVVATPSLRRKLVRELRALGVQHPHTDRIRFAFLHPGFPVDVRHNAKIHRLQLAKWASHHSGYELDKRDVSMESLRR